MIATCVYVEVKSEFINEFILACEKNYLLSIQEDGNLRFDVIQETDNLCKFLLYEAYNSESSAAVHKNTAHYLEWRATVEKMMAKPRYGIKHKILFPSTF
jgi:(4S)-4-hydroxy-5-phosphonooxypentane-2,3-dione isomerase